MYFNRKNAEQKNWRMIKKGKHFLFGCSLVFAIGAALATPTVQADTAEAKVDAAVGTAQAEPNAEGPTYAAPAATSPVATEAVEANSATTVVSVDKTQLEAVLAQAKAKSLENQEASVKAEVEAAIAEAEALVANGSASQDQINQSVERLTHAVSSVKEVTEVVAEKTSEATTDSSATPKVRSRRATTEGTTRSIDETNLARAIVTKENFESFFQEGGTASYDKSTGTIKLTDDVSGQIGSAYLRFKIDSGEAFTFTGKVDIGDKYEGHVEPGLKEGYKVSVTSTGATDPSVNPVKAGDKVVTGKAEPGSSVEITLPYGTKLSGQADKYGNFSIPVRDRPGGDGVGFVFHTGKVDTIGQSGASIGMGTIKNAFGFKLDSWHNTSNPNANQNASADPKYGGRAWESNAFGSFYSSNNAGKVTTSSSAAKALNPAPSGQWVDFKIEYDKEKNFTVTYGSQTWTTNLSKANTSIMTFDAKRALTTGNPTFALSFLGSTGSGTNLQRVQIEKFEFTAPQIVHMKFVDAKGNEIEASSAIPGDENEVINLSTQDSKIAAVEAKGYKLKRIDASKAPSYNEGNNTVTLTPGGQLLTYIFEEKDTTPPATPTVNPVKAGATAVTGTAEAGSTVEVTLPGGSKVSAKADQDGNYSVPVSALKEGDTVSVTATDDAGNKSTPTSVTVPDTTAPAAPTVNPVTAGATAVTGTAEAGSTVEVTLPDGSKATATAGEDGTFSVPVSGLKENDEVSVTATDAAKNTSTPTKVTVKETVRPVLNIPYDDADSQAIYVYSGETNNIELKVTDNSGKIVKAYLAMPADNRTGLGQEDNTYLNGKTRSGLYLNAEKIKTETTATEASPAVIRVTGDIPKNTYTDGTGMTRYLFAEDAAGNTSYEHVGANMDKGALGRIRFIWKPQSFKYTAVAPSTPITSNTVPEASAIEKAVKDANPTFSDKIGSVTLDGTNVTVTYKDGSTDVIPANSVFTIEPTAPTVTPVKNPSSLTQPEKDAVKKAVETANKTATKVEVGNDGATTLTYSNGSTATLKPEQTVSQADITAPDAPTVNPVKAGATAITGTAEAGSTVEVTLPDGTKATATADKDGNFSVPVSGLEEGQTVSVTAKDASNNTSTPTTATVAKADDKTAPDAPVVNPVKAGDKAVTGTAEAGSTVEVTLPDGTKATATADKDGNFSVPVSGLEEGQTVSVTAKDASNNTSAPTTATVAKADDTKAPDAPSVNPVKAGDKAVTGTAEAGSTVEVTLPDGTKATATADKDGKFNIPVAGLKAGDKVSVTATDAAGNKSGATDATVAPAVPVVNDGKVSEANGAKAPALTPVVDPSNLTDAEKAKIAEEVKKANPTATDVKVNNDGSVVVTFADGSVATIAANKVVKEATKESSAQAPAKKAGAKELPNTGTKQSNASLGLALLAAVTGGLLISKKRKEEE